MSHTIVIPDAFHRTAWSTSVALMLTLAYEVNIVTGSGGTALYMANLSCMVDVH